MVNRGLTRLWNRLSGEINIGSILALEDEIREHETVILKLKRTRNSLLNISKLPPEVLGDIFHWNVTPKGDFDGLEERSHNFLLVCHHWFEVASSTPELWSFWGNTPKDWARRHHRSWAAPLDLILNVAAWDDRSFDSTLLEVLQDRANRDLIRRIHLKAADSELLSSIISSLTAAAGTLRPSNVESFILQNLGSGSVDISNFFARYRFPGLRHLGLFDCTIRSWDLMTSRITALTTLDLDLWSLEPAPSASQVLSILASNPTLRKVSLSVSEDSGDAGGNPPPRVPLCNLKELKLDGNPQDVFGILGRLDHPSRLDLLDITFDPCEVEDISHPIGPYLRDYLRHRGGPQSGLRLSLTLPYDESIILHIDAGGIDTSGPAPARMNPFMVVVIRLDQRRFEDVSKKVALDLITHIPREEIVYLHSNGDPVAMGDVSARLPNLRGLHLEGTPLSVAFARPNLDGGEGILPSLQFVLLDRVDVYDGDWSPLTTFLDWRVSSGNRLHTLVMIGPYRMAPAVRRSLERSVQEFAHRPYGPTASWSTML